MFPNDCFKNENKNKKLCINRYKTFFNGRISTEVTYTILNVCIFIWFYELPNLFGFHTKSKTDFFTLIKNAYKLSELMATMKTI